MAGKRDSRDYGMTPNPGGKRDMMAPVNIVCERHGVVEHFDTEKEMLSKGSLVYCPKCGKEMDRVFDGEIALRNLADVVKELERNFAHESDLRAYSLNGEWILYGSDEEQKDTAITEALEYCDEDCPWLFTMEGGRVVEAIRVK